MASQSTFPLQIQRALQRLLQARGVYFTDDELQIKEAATRSGRKLYVVIGLNGIEQALKDALKPLAGPRAYCGAGTWVLRHEEVSKLIGEESVF